MSFSEAGDRKWARSLWTSARELKNLVASALLASKSKFESERRRGRLVSDALQHWVVVEGNNGDKKDELRPRFPTLIDDLEELAASVEQCASRPAQTVALRKARKDSIEGRRFKGRPDLNERPLTTLLTDSAGTIHYAAWSGLLKLLHPELQALRNLNRDLKIETKRRAHAAKKVARRGGTRRTKKVAVSPQERKIASLLSGRGKPTKRS